MIAHIIEHDDGIYFGLPDVEYFADPALGSGDHKALAMAPEAYWFGSLYNPARPEHKETPARLLGHGVHKAALEGAAAFQRAFVRRPDDLERLTAKERAILAPRGERVLTGDQYDRAALASAMIRAHPDLSGALANGYPEVSIFWTVEVDGTPVRCKGRFDYLRPRAILDLKSIAITQPLPFPVLCIRAMRIFKYPVQAALYLEGREHVGRFVAEGKVFGDVDAAFLDALAAASDWAFVWIFWASEGPPLVWTSQFSPTNPLLDDPRAAVEQARRNFANYRARFGTDAAWIEYEPLRELTVEDFETAYGRHL